MNHLWFHGCTQDLVDPTDPHLCFGLVKHPFFISTLGMGTTRRTVAALSKTGQEAICHNYRILTCLRRRLARGPQTLLEPDERRPKFLKPPQGGGGPAAAHGPAATATIHSTSRILVLGTSAQRPCRDTRTRVLCRQQTWPVHQCPYSTGKGAPQGTLIQAQPLAPSLSLR